MLQESVERVAAGQAVKSASLLQRRDTAAKVAMFAGALFGYIIARSVDGGPLITGAIVGGAAGLGQLPFVEYWIVAVVDAEVALCRASPWLGRAKELSHRGVSISRAKRNLLSDTYSTPIGELSGSSLRRGEIDRIIGQTR